MNPVFDRKSEANKLANIEQMANDLAHVTLPTHKVKWMINRIRELEREAANVITVFPQMPPNYDDHKTAERLLTEFTASGYAFGRRVYTINADRMDGFHLAIMNAIAKARTESLTPDDKQTIDGVIDRWVSKTGIALSPNMRANLYMAIASSFRGIREAAQTPPADDSTVNKYCVIGTNAINRTFKPTVDEAIEHCQDLVRRSGGSDKLLVVKVAKVVERGQPTARDLRPNELG